MLEKEKMDRLNELARKKKVSELTVSEEAEQKALRKEYLTLFRSHIKDTLENVTILDPEGNDVTPSKVKKSGKNNQSEEKNNHN